MAQDTEQEIWNQRIEKVDRLAGLDGQRYPNDFRVTHSMAEVIAGWGETGGEELEARPVRLALAGRAMAINSFGKAAFLRVRDRSGVLQVYVRKDSVDEASFERLRLTDIGDIVAAEGTLFRTRTGELTLKAEGYRVLSKSMRPLPEKWHGLKDAELRQRMRYVDLIVSEESRKVFQTRAAIVRHIRRFLDERGFMEVETPMMHSVLGGANARPFRTHHNTLDMDLYLRIAPELFLKRLVVGGIERVYEVNRNFRNEGISVRHNPEFTMLEFYWAYATYQDLMTLTEELLSGLAVELFGTTRVKKGEVELDFSPPFRRLSVCGALGDYCGATDMDLRDAGAAFVFARAHGVPEDEAKRVLDRHGAETSDASRNAALELGMLVFEREVEDRLVQPTFVTDFPLAVSPLSRKKDADPALVDRFELYVNGGEVANAFSELNDPVDQAERFRFQLRARAAGDDEAMEFDEDYVRALEYGMPPTAGEGIGIDRLTMLMTDQDSIRDVILFPLLRPGKGA